MLPSDDAYFIVGDADDNLTVCRLITGLWQTAGHHGYMPETSAVSRKMADLVENGFCTFEIPGGDDTERATELAGAYRSLVGRRFADSYTQIMARIDLDARLPGVSSRRYVEGVVDTVLTRMRAERLDLLSIAWTGAASDERYLDVLCHASALRRSGKVRFVGLVEFPTAALDVLYRQGMRVEFNVVPYSLLDTRPAQEMADWCSEHGVRLFAASTIGGGFLSERYLGVPEPTRRALATESLRKFAVTIRSWGGWSLFQELLFVLKGIGDKHRVSVANVALRWVLEQPAVDAVIVGARLGLGPEAEHFADNARVFRFTLDHEDLHAIEEVTSRANNLYEILGDAGSESFPP